ncbi:hypothetical protein QYF36_011481 [Acer negundo]|nr:hypothetical protein QYF36_011481 [Acer negundo]
MGGGGSAAISTYWSSNLGLRLKDFPKLKTIKLSNSHNLIETPDFTMVPNLEMLDLKGADGCHSLEDASLRGCTSPAIAMHLFNCPKLIQNRGHHDINLAVMLLKQCLQVCHSFLDLFRARNKKEDLKDLDGIKEYAHCCMSIIGNGYQISSGPRRYPTLESGHLWLTYMPRVEFEHDRSLTLESSHLRYSEYEYDSTNSVLVSTGTCIHARFDVVGTSGVPSNSKVIKSGIRLVYKGDIRML